MKRKCREHIFSHLVTIWFCFQTKLSKQSSYLVPYSIFCFCTANTNSSKWNHSRVSLVKKHSVIALSPKCFEWIGWNNDSMTQWFKDSHLPPNYWHSKVTDVICTKSQTTNCSQSYLRTWSNCCTSKVK